MGRKQFTFYNSYWDEIRRFTKKKDRLRMFDAVIEYALNRNYPQDLNQTQRGAFNRMLPKLDADWRSAAEIRRSKEYAQWRNFVFRRDDFTCMMCGKRGVKLNAHHIKPFALHEQRLDVDNGITLCECCHRKVHHGT